MHARAPARRPCLLRPMCWQCRGALRLQCTASRPGTTLSARSRSVRATQIQAGAASMKTTFLDFERPVAELEEKIAQLRFVQDDPAVDLSGEIARLEKKSESLTRDLYAKLTPWQI